MCCVKQELLNIRPHNDVLFFSYVTDLFAIQKVVISNKATILAGQKKMMISLIPVLGVELYVPAINLSI